MTTQLPLTRPLPSLLAASGNPGPAPTMGANASPSSQAYSGYGSPNGFGATSPLGSPSLAASGLGSPNSSLGTGLGGGSLGTGSLGGSDFAGAGNGDYAPAPTSPASSYYSAGSTASPPSTGGYGAAASPSASTPAVGAGTQQYGVSSLSAYGGLAGAAAKPAAAGYGQAAYAPTGAAAGAGAGGAGAAARNTQIYGQTLTNWQPSLPVSPWGTVDRPVLGGGAQTETILRSELSALRRAKWSARLWAFIFLCAAGGIVYFGARHVEQIVVERDQAQEQARTERLEREKVERARTETLSRIGDAGPAAGATAGKAAGPASAGSIKLIEDLKKALAGAPQVAVESRGDRVLITVDASSMFAGKETEVGLGGYRTLYKLGKVLKSVKDRRVGVTVPAIDIKKAKAWNLSAARAVSLGRFFTDDLGFERSRVAISAPAPRVAGKIVSKSGLFGRVEIALDPLGT